MIIRKNLLAAVLASSILASSTSFAAEQGGGGNGEGDGGACCDSVVTAINTLQVTLLEQLKKGFDAVMEELNKITTSSDDFINKTLDSFSSSNDQFVTVATNGNVQAGTGKISWVGEDSQEMTNKTIEEFLTMDSKQLKAKAKELAELVPKKSDDDFNVADFSVGDLINKTVLDDDQETEAKNVIDMLSGAGSIVQNLPESFAEAQNVNVDAFRNSFASYTAKRSVGLNYLNTVYSNRKVQKGLGDQAKIPGTPDASPLQLLEYNATEPLSSQWMSQLNDANPADVQKMQLYISARILNMQYQNYRQLELLNATLATMQLQELEEFAGDRLEKQRLKAVQSIQ